MSKPKTAELARGRWPGILKAMGISDEFLRNKHGPCPICGGKDRFRFDDKEGSGSFYCETCRPGDGFDLLMKFTGGDFASVAKQVESLCHMPVVERRADQDTEQKRDWCRSKWGETLEITESDPVWRYLDARIGIDQPPRAVRYHPSLFHKESSARFPAMLAKVTNHDGESVGLHRTYLSMDGAKAAVEEAKKTFVWKRQEGAAVRLCPPAERMGIAEGIETALAASKLFSVPCWSALTARGVFDWVPPPAVKEVIIFGDNDLSFTGHAAAYGLAWRLKKRNGILVEVKIPEQQGKDWADV